MGVEGERGEERGEERWEERVAAVAWVYVVELAAKGLLRPRVAAEARRGKVSSTVASAAAQGAKAEHRVLAHQPVCRGAARSVRLNG
jgi:hypothetical protein